MLSTPARWFILSLAGLLVLSLTRPASGQDLTANVELRVWQRIADPLRIYVSARPEGGSWSTLGTIPLALDQRNSRGTFRYGDIDLRVSLARAASQDSTANVELRVWQRIADPLRIYVSARPEGGSWSTLGTIPLALSDRTSSGTFRYGDITLAVPLPAVTTQQPFPDTQNLRWLEWNYPALYRQVEGLRWARDGVTETERTALDNLLYIAVEDVPNFRSVLGLRWVSDAITETESESLEWLVYLNQDSAQDAATIIALPWFQDDLAETELGALRSLVWLDYEDGTSGVDITQAVVARQWIRDGISQAEHDLLLWLAYLDYWSEEAAVAVVDMPFLSSIERDDVLAVRGLHQLASSRDGRLNAVLTHPNVRDGITDDETTLVAATGTIRGASEVRRILEPGNARTEVVFEKTRYTPNLKISIIRTGTQPRQATIDDIRDSVEFVEGIMSRPLPVSHIIVVVDDYAVTEGYGGTNYGFAFSVLSDDERHESPYDTFDFRSKIIHETAHFFWRDHASWIDEGVANTFEYLYGVDEGVSPGQRETPHRGICEAHDLEMLTEWDASLEQQGRYGCNYFLGQLLFQELLEELGRTAFSQRLRELYLLSLDTKEDPEAETPGIAEVREAFANQAAIVEKHWSGALNAPENRPVDDGTRGHSLVRWDQRPISDGRFVTFRGTLLGDAVLSKETNADARTGGQPNFTLASVGDYDSVGSVLPPLTSGRWVLNDPGDVVATDYDVNDGTFTVRFRFPQALGDPSDYAVLVLGFQDGSRSSFFGWEVDILGSARIVESTATIPPSAPDTPTGVSASKIDIPLAFDDIRVTWNAVAGATWYEVYHATPGTQFDFEATVSDASYLDEWPNVLYPDSYIVRACNNAGCSEFSAVVTQY